METLRQCPSCGHDHIKFSRQVKDYFLSQEEFRIFTCFSCGLMFTNPRPSAEESGKYYQSEEYISHSNKSQGLFARMYQVIRNRNLKWKRDTVKSYLNKGSILDIGCGTGEFLHTMKEDGWSCMGIEPDAGARNYGRDHYDLTVETEAAIKGLENESQDIISLWHVLEHVHSLNERVADIYRLLKPGAYALIALPNPSSYDAQHYQEFWAAWDVPRHLYHFTSAAVISLFKHHSLTFCEAHPMKFDAYYVSMLSEKYKASSLSTMRGLLMGAKSNLKAGKNSELYSSTLYVFQKDSIVD